MSLLTYLCLVAFSRTVPLVFLPPFTFRRRLRFSKMCTFLLAAAVCAFQMVMTFYTFQPNYFGGWPRAGFSMITLLFLYAFNLLLVKANPFQVLFTFLVAKSYQDNVALFVEILREYFKAVNGGDSLALQIKLIFSLMLLSMPFILLFLEKCVRPIVDSNTDLNFWRYLWCIPACFYFIYRLGIFPGYLSSENLCQKGSFLLPYAWTITTFLAYYVILRMLSETVKNALLTERLHTSSLQISMQRELYESLRSSVEDTRRLRHDLRHHLTALKGYTGRGDCSGAEKYLDSFLNNLRTDATMCENYAVDAIMRHYAMLAKKNNTTFEVTLELPQTLAIPESDVCVVLGNLLENSVEACARQIGGGRFIQIRAAIVGRSMIAINVRNSYTGEIYQSGEAFLSSKREGEGVGISSVRAITEQYQGTAKFEFSDGVFSASVLLVP